MRNPESVYWRFVEFEERAADIYLQLASRFSPENPDLSAVWLDMAIQEKQHAGLLQFCLAEKLFASFLPSPTQIHKFSRLFAILEKRARDPQLDVDGAFAVAAELEALEVNAVYCHLTTPLHASPYLLKRKIAATPANHIEQLASEARRIGIADTILKKLEDLKDRCPDTGFQKVSGM